MPLGKKLGAYEVIAKLGEGGMGEVYRATDARLKRQVAIKVLPPSLAVDADRLARFQREAEVLASLNHPNIAAIYGLEESGGMTALVMELVDGEDLSQRIARGAIPIDDALPIAKQIADALEAAHEQGIVHRDLKPANIKVRSDGMVKVLDFGLAKALDSGAAGSTDATASPTITSPALMTRNGVILGTAAYMSPEQARGKRADRRADIWAFGAVVYEMLTARRAFTGSDVQETLAAILRDEPDWSALPGETPARVRRALQLCLRKDPHQRVRDVAAIRLAMEGAFETEAATTAVRRSLLQRTLPWMAAVVMSVATGLAVAWSLRPAASPPVARFLALLETPERLDPSMPAVSPNGEYLAYTSGLGGARSLFLYRLAELDAKPIVQIDGASLPFFSPDSAWLGFFVGNELKKVSVRGGPPQTLARVAAGRGASWGRDGHIVFAPSFRSALSRVSAEGGTVEAVTTLDPRLDESGHRNPVLLPSGRAIIYTALLSRGSEIVVTSLDTGKRVVLVQGGEYPQFVPTGHLLYQQSRRLMAAPFDVDRLALTGAAVPVIDSIDMVTSVGVSDGGLLVYRSGSAGPSALVWVDRKGSVTALDAERRFYTHPRLSPDGRRIVVNVPSNLWIHDLQARTVAQLTFEGGNFPVWTPDSLRVIYGRPRTTTGWDIFWKPADGSGSEQGLVTRALDQTPAGASIPRDSQLFAFRETTSNTSADLWFRSMRDGNERVFVNGPADEKTPAFSPDGRFVAYVSNELGPEEVFVRPLAGEGLRRVSYDGGVEPVWAATGELFYRHRNQMLIVDITTAPELVLGTPRTLFEGPYALSPIQDRNYDITPDGQRFLMVRAADPNEGTVRLNAIVNWFEELKRLVPTK